MPSIDYSQLQSWFIPLACAAGLSFVFSTIYVFAGHSHSNRRSFAGNFILIATITCAIIMVIKQSIALSLGLVGALSIVRFRVAIKEPEELSYLFLMIAIGIGTGAGELGLVLVFSLIIGLIVIARYIISGSSKKRGSYNVNIVSKKAGESGIPALSDIFRKWCVRSDIRRFDENEGLLDVLYYAEFADETSLGNWREDLKQFDQHVRITFLDPAGVF